MPGSPIIDGHDRTQILADLIERAPAYVPEWAVAVGTPAYALLAILARDIEIQAAAENGMPGGARLGFLSALGNSLLPAQSARTPLVFQLMPNAPLDVTLGLAARGKVSLLVPCAIDGLRGEGTRGSRGCRAPSRSRRRRWTWCASRLHLAQWRYATAAIRRTSCRRTSVYITGLLPR